MDTEYFKNYQNILETEQIYHKGLLSLPPVVSYGILRDPRQVGFRFARHKFVVKMIGDKSSILEIGCQEGFTSLMVGRYVKRLLSVDFYEQHIADAKKYIQPFLENVEFRVHDILKGPVLDGEKLFDAGFCMDVFEHIPKQFEENFFKNVCDSLKDHAPFILGIPSLESQLYASKASRLGHVNCKTGEEFKMLCERYFRNVFLFSMNDEVVHTGFYKMAHYLIAVCVCKM